MSGCVGMLLCRIPTHFFGNIMVIIHPSLFKKTDTRSAEAFWDERIEGLLTWRKAAKDAILAADAFFMVFPFFIGSVK